MWVALLRLQPELFAWDKHIDDISAPHFDIDPRTDTEGLGQLNFGSKELLISVPMMKKFVYMTENREKLHFLTICKMSSILSWASS